MRATIDWSYQLLADHERDVFERLGAFGDSFTIEAARSVVGGDALAVLSSLSALVDKSLLVHAASESETRFRMLQVVSEYAAERLGDRPDADAIRIAHADHYADVARAAYAGLRGIEQRGWKEVLDLDRENVRRTLVELEQVGRLDDAAGLVWSMLLYWLTGRYLEGRKLVGQLLGAQGELSDASRARLQTVGGVLAALLSDIATAHAELGAAVEWFDTHDDDEGRATALVGLGLATAPIDVDRARELMRESARLFAGIGDAWGEAIVLGALGWLNTGRGDFAEETLFERGYSLARYVDDEVSTAHNGTNLAELHLALGRPDEAREVLEVALDAFEAVRLYDGLSYGLEAAAGLTLTGSRAEAAARLLGAADGLRDEVGVPIWGPRLTRFESLVATAREALGEEFFDRLWAEGRALDYDGALEAARGALEPAAPGLEPQPDRQASRGWVGPRLLFYYACARLRARKSGWRSRAGARPPGPDSTNSFAEWGGESTPLLLRARATSTRRSRHPALLSAPTDVLDCRPLATVAQCCTAGTRASTYSPPVRSSRRNACAPPNRLSRTPNRVPAGSGSRIGRRSTGSLMEACARAGRTTEAASLCWAARASFPSGHPSSHSPATPSPVDTQFREACSPCGPAGL